jgi:hypothetical protein
MRVSIDEKFLQGLQADVGDNIKGAQLTSEALALLKWAFGEIQKGKKIMAVDEKKQEKKEITLPSFSLLTVKE